MIKFVDIFNNPSFTGLDDKTLVQQTLRDIESAGCYIINSKKIKQENSNLKGTRITFEYDMNKAITKKRGVI